MWWISSLRNKRPNIWLKTSHSYHFEWHWGWRLQKQRCWGWGLAQIETLSPGLQKKEATHSWTCNPECIMSIQYRTKGGGSRWAAPPTTAGNCQNKPETSELRALYNRLPLATNWVLFWFYRGGVASYGSTMTYFTRNPIDTQEAVYSLSHMR